jgi:hypothetical protein
LDDELILSSVVREKQMKATRSLNAYGSPDFEIELTAELELFEGQLPLEFFCKWGGWPKESAFRVEAIEDRENEILVSVSVIFTEEESTDCSSFPRRYEGMTGKLMITICKEDAETEVESIRED